MIMIMIVLVVWIYGVAFIKKSYLKMCFLGGVAYRFKINTVYNNCVNIFRKITRICSLVVCNWNHLDTHPEVFICKKFLFVCQNKTQIKLKKILQIRIDWYKTWDRKQKIAICFTHTLKTTPSYRLMYSFTGNDRGGDQGRVKLTSILYLYCDFCDRMFLVIILKLDFVTQ